MSAVRTTVGTWAQGWTASEVGAGNFYLYNVGANAYLENGVSWGTHAALKNGGFVVNVTSVGGGKYTIDTNSKYSGKHFGYNGYVDNGDANQNWTFEPVEGQVNTYRLKTDEGYYAYAAAGMCNVELGSDPGTNKAYWKLVTADNRNAGTNATYLTPVEWTHKINNPRFDDNVSGWLGTEPARGGNISGTNGNVPTWDDFNPCAEHFNKTYDTYQELTGLSNGVYAVSVQGFYRQGGYNDAAAKHVAGTESLNAILYANNAEQPLMSIFEEAGKASGGVTATATGIDGVFPDNMSAASYFFSAGLYWNTVYVEVTDGNLKIGVKKSTTVGSDWTIFDSFRLQYFGDDCTVEQAKNAAVKKVWDDAYSAAVSARDNAAYENVVGAERTALNTEIAKEEPTTAEGYVTATQSLSTATSNFIAAAPNYVLLATEKTKAENLGMSAAAIAEATPLTKTGLKALQDLKVAEYDYVTANYPYGVTLGEWTSTGTNTSAATFNNEHWSGETHDYKNQNDANGQGWNANSWSINFSQDVLLPSGTYVFKVAGRQASGDQVTTSLVVKKGEDVLGSVNDFPRSNNARGINKSGETAFEGEASTFANGGNGFGWEWRYVKFTLDEEATVNIAVNAVATAIHQWVSFGDYTLQADNDDVVDILAYNVAKASAITVRDDAQYANVIGSERTALVNAINADPSSDYPAATTALNEASAAVVAAKPSYDAYALAKSYADAIDASALPYAASAKILAVATAKGATVTTAAEAVTATGNINTANRAAYESNMNAEGVVGAKNRTAVMTNPEGSNTAGWSGEFWTASNEPYTDASGSATHTYFDKNNVTSFTSSQTVKLPAGNYIVSVTARAQAGITYTLQVTNNADENEDLALTAIGNANGVFNRGWNVFTLPFTQKAYGDATISISGSNTSSFWMSWGRFIIYNVGNEEAVPVNETVDFAATGQIEDVDVTLTRTIKEGVNTLVLPFSMTQDEVKDKFGTGSIVYKVGSYNSENDNISFTKRDGIAANEPCILKATVAGSSYEFEDRTIVAENNPVATGEGVSVVGSYNASTDITKNDNNYIISGGKIYLVNSDGVSMKGTRAYIKLSEPNSARELILNFDDVTAIKAIEVANAKAEGLKDGKYLIGNKVVIVKNGVKYSVNGQKLN